MLPSGNHLLAAALPIGLAAFRLGQDVHQVLEVAGFTKNVIEKTIHSIMSPPGKKQTKKGKGSTVTKSQNVPKNNFGADHLLGLPQRTRRTLSSVYVSALVNTAGAYDYDTYVLNSAYKPDSSTSATGFDKYMAFYQRCFVLGAKFTIKSVFAPGTSKPTLHGCTIATNNVSFTETLKAIENGLSEYVLGWKNPDRATFQNGVDTGKFLTKPNVLDDKDLYCTSTSTSASQVVLHVWSGGLAAEDSAVTYVVEILQDVMFVDPIPFT